MDRGVVIRGGVPVWLDQSAYPFASRWQELPGGHRMHYIDEGQGPTVLFVHGTPSWSFEWRLLVRSLSTSFRCIAPDHLGFGLSDRPRQGAYTPEWHADNLKAFVQGLGLGAHALVVHDFGGPIGLPLALEAESQVTRLAVLNTWMWSLAGDAGVERAASIVGGPFGRFLYRRANFSLRVIMPAAFADRKKLTRSMRAHYMAPFPDAWSREAVLWALARSLLGSSAHYESLWRRRDALAATPSLIVWGMKDPAFRPHHLARWRDALPRAEVVELPVGHWPQEESPGLVAVALARFLGAS